MTNEEKMAAFDSGYNEGFLFAAQAVASRVLRLIYNHPSWMLEPDRKAAIAEIKMTTKYCLQKRGVIPYSHDVITGKSDEVPVNFDLDY